MTNAESFSNADVSQAVLHELRNRPPHEVVELTVSLAELPFDFTQFQETRGEERKALIAKRKAQTDSFQNMPKQQIESLGGHIISSQWLVNQLNIKIAAGRVKDIIAIKDVTGIYLAEPLQEEANWDGAHIRSAMMIDHADLQNNKADFYTGCDYGNSPCYNGGGTPQITIGIIESSSMMHPNHVGYSTGGPPVLNSRRALYTWDCTGSNCIPDFGSGLPADPNHAATVAWCAAGSIENGEDPNYPGYRTLEQRQRSGVAGGSWIIGFLSSTSANIGTALETATDQEIGIINMSFGIGSCNDVNTITYNPSNLNPQFENAAAAGILLVTSAGNKGHSTGACTITYPAWRPEILAIGALDTYNTPSNAKLVDVDMAKFSSRGGARMRTIDGRSRKFSGVDLAAPGCVQYDYTDDFDGYNDSAVENCGTSFAAPIISGTAAIFREALRDIGWTATANSAQRLLTNLLLFGNGWDADSDAKTQFIISEVSGFGHTLAHYPSSHNLTAPWRWSSVVEGLLPGNTKIISISDTPLSSNVTQLKIATTTYERDLNAQSWYWMSVNDTCNNNQLLALDISPEPRKRFLITDLANKCPELRIVPYDIPNNGLSVALAFYYHSADPEYQH